MKFTLHLCLFLSFFLFLTTFASAEEITDFNSKITPFTDGSFLIEETIQYDFKNTPKHGIFRYFLTDHPQPATVWYKNRKIEYDVTAVTMDGGAVPFLLTESSGKVEVKIGDADKEITGLHIYSISYLVRGGLHYYEDGVVEIYWDVTGSDWPGPILASRATLLADTGLLKDERFCYTGYPGETESCRDIVATTTGVTFTAPVLGPGAEFTIAQELDGTKVAVLIVEDSPTWVLWVVGLALWFLGVAFWVYKYKTKYNPHQTVISQYEPFEDFKPMFTGVLIDGRLDDKDITAGLVYLAEQGFLKIRKTEAKVLLFFEVDDYEVTLLRAISEAETNFLRDVLTLLFDDYNPIGTTVKLSKLKADTGKRKANALRVSALRDAVLVDLVTRGFYERVLALPLVVLIIIACVFVLPFLLPFLFSLIGSLAVPLLVLLVGTAIILGFGYQRRTRKGYEALNHLKGFKDFLSVTETERLKFHNAPEKSPEQFMQFLPYAIALGVEKQWSAVFKDIQLVSPSWYEGSGTFSAVALTSDLGAFSSSFTASNTNPSSGSSGGGFSGGGGGGGGGGSW